MELRRGKPRSRLTLPRYLALAVGLLVVAAIAWPDPTPPAVLVAQLQAMREASANGRDSVLYCALHPATEAPGVTVVPLADSVAAGWNECLLTASRRGATVLAVCSAACAPQDIEAAVASPAPALRELAAAFPVLPAVAAGGFDEGLGPSGAGVAADLALRLLAQQHPRVSHAELSGFAAAAASLPGPASWGGLIGNPALHAVVASPEEGRADAAGYLESKWDARRGVLSTAPDTARRHAALRGAAQQYRDCVRTGTGLRLRLGGDEAHCLLPTADEVIRANPGPPHRDAPLAAGWERRLERRLGVLLRLGQLPGRRDRVPSFLSPATRHDAGLLEHAVGAFDVPLGCAAVLLNTPCPDAEAGLRWVQDTLRAQGLAFAFLQPPQQVSVSAAWNQLARYALRAAPEEPYVLITQPDVFADPGWLAHYQSHMADVIRRDVSPLVELWEFAAFGVTRRWLEVEGGLFDENIFPAYGEDVEMTLRVRAAGREVLRSPIPDRHRLHLRSITVRRDPEAAVRIKVRWQRENYLWRKWGFDHRLHFSDRHGVKGAATRQFRRPWNSRRVPLNESWVALDDGHRRCVWSGGGPEYRGCPGSCLFDVRSVARRWPGALDADARDVTGAAWQPHDLRDTTCLDFPLPMMAPVTGFVDWLLGWD